MRSDSAVTTDLLNRAGTGDNQALTDLFARHQPRLRQMVRLRLDRRLQGRINPSEILREAYNDLARRLPEYTRDRTLPFFLWLRSLAGQKLMDLHRRHLGSATENTGQEVSLYRGALPQASSASLAAHLLGRLASSSQASRRVEMQTRLQDVLNGMDSLDREILTLRHFEMLDNDETAAVLGISSSEASNGFIRALKRLKDTLASLSGFGSS